MTGAFELAKRPESLTALVQTRLTPTESEALDNAVAFYQQQGTPATRSAVVRTFILAGLRDFKDATTGQ